ncbi:MAG: DUF4129 domain-containing protein [Chloroflexota bacterium]
MTISKATSIAIAPHSTLREYLKAAISSLPSVTEPFGELTKLAEDVLYSAHKLGEDMVSRAEQLARVIKKELSGGDT